MEPYSEHAYLEMDISQLQNKVGELEKSIKRLDEIALILLPKGFKREIEATKRIETVVKDDGEGGFRHINTTYCTHCEAKVGCDDMYCRNCGATFIGFSVGVRNED